MSCKFRKAGLDCTDLCGYSLHDGGSCKNTAVENEESDDEDDESENEDDEHIDDNDDEI